MWSAEISPNAMNGTNCGGARCSEDCADDCQVIRRTAIFGAGNLFHIGLSATLRDAPGIELVGQWDLAAAGTVELTPHDADVAVVDLDVWGAHCVQRLCASRPTGLVGPLPVVALTASEDEDSSAQALCAGARGVLLKDTGPGEIVDAIHAVGHGAVVLAPHLVAWLLDEMLRNSRRGVASSLEELNGSVPADLAVTPRQEEILTLVASGLSNAEIAGRLHLSTPTVKSHVSALLRTFNVRDRTKLALLANQLDSA